MKQLSSLQTNVSNWHKKVDVIHWQLSKTLKFDHVDRWYMYKQESVINNESHKVLFNFAIQADYPIPIRRPNKELSIKKKRVCLLVYVAVPADME